MGRAYRKHVGAKEDRATRHLKMSSKDDSKGSERLKTKSNYHQMDGLYNPALNLNISHESQLSQHCVEDNQNIADYEVKCKPKKAKKKKSNLGVDQVNNNLTKGVTNHNNTLDEFQNELKIDTNEKKLPKQEEAMPLDTIQLEQQNERSSGNKSMRGNENSTEAKVPFQIEPPTEEDLKDGVVLKYKEGKLRKYTVNWKSDNTSAKKSYKHLIQGDILLQFKGTNFHMVKGYAVKKSKSSKKNEVVEVDNEVSLKYVENKGCLNVSDDLEKEVAENSKTKKRKLKESNSVESDLINSGLSLSDEADGSLNGSKDIQEEVSDSSKRKKKKLKKSQSSESGLDNPALNLSMEAAGGLNGTTGFGEEISQTSASKNAKLKKSQSSESGLDNPALNLSVEVLPETSKSKKKKQKKSQSSEISLNNLDQNLTQEIEKRLHKLDDTLINTYQGSEHTSSSSENSKQRKTESNHSQTNSLHNTALSLNISHESQPSQQCLEDSKEVADCKVKRKQKKKKRKAKEITESFDLVNNVFAEGVENLNKALDEFQNELENDMNEKKLQEQRKLEEATPLDTVQLQQQNECSTGNKRKRGNGNSVESNAPFQIEPPTEEDLKDGVVLKYTQGKLSKYTVSWRSDNTSAKKSYKHLIQGDILLQFKGTNFHMVEGYAVKNEKSSKKNEVVLVDNEVSLKHAKNKGCLNVPDDLGKEGAKNSKTKKRKVKESNSIESDLINSGPSLLHEADGHLNGSKDVQEEVSDSSKRKKKKVKESNSIESDLINSGPSLSHEADGCLNGSKDIQEEVSDSSKRKKKKLNKSQSSESDLDPALNLSC